MASRTALVTGGAGFIGSHLTDDLLALGLEVVVLDDLSGGSRDNVNSAARFVEGNIGDVELVSRLFDEHRFRYVYHLAAYAAEGLSHFIRRYNYNNNVVGSVNVLDAAVNAGTEVFVFTSSIAVYGATAPPMDESMTPRPEDPYGIAKLAVEQDLRAAHEMFGLKFVVFRPHNVYGERQNIGDPYRNVIGIFMNQIMQGKPMTVFGDGDQSRAFSYVRDVTPIIARAAMHEPAWAEVFNIGADTPYSVKQLATAVAEAMGVSPDIAHLEERLEVKHAYCSHDKVARVFGAAAQTPLEEGLRRMAGWARTVGVRSTPPVAHIEIERNLPPSWRTSPPLT